MKVQYLDPRCSGVEVKVLGIGNTQVKVQIPQNSFMKKRSLKVKIQRGPPQAWRASGCCH